MSTDTPTSPGPTSPTPSKLDFQPLSVQAQLTGRRLVVFGGTGFLGKVWCALLLSNFPDFDHIYLVVRPKEGLDVEQRFRDKILGSEVFHGLREAHGPAFEEFVRSKVTPIAGDPTQPLGGVAADLREDIRGRIDAVINVAGVVEFTPPLDVALEVNAFGCQNLVALAKDLGDVPVLHTSTCFTAGSRTGAIEELDPREFPFPRAGELDVSGWNPETEIAECLDVIEQARHRANDAFRQSRFRDEAKQNLRERHEPPAGVALDDELAKVRRRFIERQLADLGTERARFWGWPNTYTYTKSLGEQIVAGSGLPFCIVRPAIVESTNSFPFPGWNEGINTSAPLIFLIREGGLQVPGSHNNLDLIPCDMVCGAIVLALAELLEGRAKPVYQAAASDTNPCSMARFFELSGLHKRRLYRETQKGGPLLAAIQQRYESALLSKEQYETYGPRRLAEGAEALGTALSKFDFGPLSSVLKPAAKQLDGFARQQKKLARIMDTFLPFMAEYNYVFKTDAVRAAHARLSTSERDLIPWGPEQLDWREWFLNVHAPALERHVFPEMERRLRKGVTPPRAHETLVTLVDGMAERHGLRVALCRTEQEGLSRLSFRELRTRSLGVAAWLRQHGVRSGDAVLLSGRNDPAWVVAFFGVLYAGATATPLDFALDPDSALNIAKASGARVLIADSAAVKNFGVGLDVQLLPLAECLDLQGDPVVELGSPAPDDVACLIYTSGTTGKPKGVMLSHRNLTALVASLSPLFPLGSGDRLLSVLPLHHTFELTCGLLLPLSRGARVVYLDRVTKERLSAGLQESRATALIGVPALWQTLERRIIEQIAAKGPFAEWAFDAAVQLSRAVGRQTGLDVGRSLFGSVHRALGGNLRYLVSGGAALSAETHSLFQGLGLHLAEGYGLTESSPVLTVAQGGPRARGGQVGAPIPGVEIRIKTPAEDGVGEVLARGPNVMLGYRDDAEATAAVIDEDGWLHTGDLGTLDHKGRLRIVGRAKDVVVGASGENLYPDDIEARIGAVAGVIELCCLGVPDGRGAEVLALAAVVDAGVGGDRSERHDRARAELRRVLGLLPPAQRPAVVSLFDEPLPRTSTRKVKRGELRRLLEGAPRSTDRPGVGGDELLALVQSTVATISRRRPSEIFPALNLRADLGFDSLMALELLVGLETKLGRALDAEKLSRAVTIGELVEELRGSGVRRSSSRTDLIEGTPEVSFRLPAPLREAAMEWMGRGQTTFYSNVMRTKVTGRAFVPHNRQTLVVANHCSHLDMGLIKYALGSYGREMVTLAAQDYFFEGNRYRKAFFEQFSHLEPMPRSGSLRTALRKAGQLLDRGKTVLIFPEGTRSDDGNIQPFKPAVGHLALRHGVDVLPVWVGGTASALPKGARVPMSRNLEARIGPPLASERLVALTKGLSAADAGRVVARVAEQAVRALGEGRDFELEQVDVADLRTSAPPRVSGLAGVFQELEARFVPGAIERPLSYYFSLGQERWTVRVTAKEVEVARGKQVGSADCVLKTSPEAFERIVREAWVPRPADFVSGQLKTSNVAHLLTMQKLFRLDVPTERLDEHVPRASGDALGGE